MVAVNPPSAWAVTVTFWFVTVFVTWTRAPPSTLPAAPVTVVCPPLLLVVINRDVVINRKLLN